MERDSIEEQLKELEEVLLVIARSPNAPPQLKAVIDEAISTGELDKEKLLEVLKDSEVRA